MAMRNATGRVNYQPNSFGVGPRESPTLGHRSFEAMEEGPKARLRSESFADHYSQARQFFRSQTPSEQSHIIDALTFELSKVELPVIRERMISHLLNIDSKLAKAVAAALGLKDMPKPADAAVKPKDLDASPALSIVLNGLKNFKGRKVGALVTDGADADLLAQLTTTLEKEGATLEVIAPKIGGITASDKTLIPAKHMLGGGPSVLFDAVVLLGSDAGFKQLMKEAPARDFVADAFAHLKFIGHVKSALPLLAKAGVPEHADAGVMILENAKSISEFIKACSSLRLWAREEMS